MEIAILGQGGQGIQTAGIIIAKILESKGEVVKLVFYYFLISKNRRIFLITLCDYLVLIVKAINNHLIVIQAF